MVMLSALCVWLATRLAGYEREIGELIRQSSAAAVNQGLQHDRASRLELVIESLRLELHRADTELARQSDPNLVRARIRRMLAQAQRAHIDPADTDIPEPLPVETTARHPGHGTRGPR